MKDALLPRILLRLGFLLLLVVLPQQVFASWYWPFDFDPDSTNKPPRLHRLLEKANEHIELAEDEALEGNGDKAVEQYRLALRELDRVELENPDRAESPEFAPLRTKRASCSAAIDAIRFAQVDENERAVSVTDTRELEKRWRKKHGMMTPEDMAETPPARPSSPKEPPAKSRESTGVQVAKSSNVGPVAKETALDSESAEQLQLVIQQIRRGDYAAADLLLDRLVQRHPTDLRLLLLRAAAQSGTGSNYAARRTLEKAVAAHPESYLPHYNLATLALRLGEGVESARQHYQRGRAVGGPRNDALENSLK